MRRFFWGMVSPFFRLSPRLCYGWRNLFLRLFGARVGKGVRVYPSAEIFAPWNLTLGEEVTIGWRVRLYCLAPVTVGARTIISQHAHLCAGSHDFRQAHFPFDNRPITIGSDVWIAADAFIGNGVTVGRLGVVGARAVVVKNVPESAIVAGNPARVIGRR